MQKMGSVLIDDADRARQAMTPLRLKMLALLREPGSAATLATYSNLNAASGYVLKTISLNAYIGKTVTLKFSGAEDSSLQTSFVLDDVAVNVQ